MSDAFDAAHDTFRRVYREEFAANMRHSATRDSEDRREAHEEATREALIAFAITFGLGAGR